MKYCGFDITLDCWIGFNESYNKDKDKYDIIYDRLGDEVSRDTFRRILNLRVNLDISNMEVFKVNEEEQYFEPFLGLNEVGESFADIGGYDGYTSLQFIKKCPFYDTIFFFEPEPRIMEGAKNKLAGENVIFYEAAASSRQQILRFSSQSSSSKITEKGELVICANTIDNMIGDAKVTYLKMDIEGAESEAIEGAKNVILKNHPKMAICVYHKACDLIDLPYQIFAIRDDYNIYLRHYTEGTAETVMYFVPQNKV